MEIFKAIPSFEGLYEASNYGRIRSLDRVVHRNGSTTKMLKGKLLKIWHQRNGYQTVVLCKEGKSKSFRVHRLVGITFIPNPNNYPEINHINEDKDDNRVENLEWVSRKENCSYGTRNKRTVANRNQSGENNGMFGRKGKLNPQSKPVQQLSLNGDIIAQFESVRIASKETNINDNSISRCANGYLKTAGGYKWQYFNQLQY